MTTLQKSNLIQSIVQNLKAQAQLNNDCSFCVGDTFFSLAFKTDEEIKKIAKLAGV